MSFSGVFAKAVADAEKVKAALLKAMTTLDGIVVKVSADAPEIAAVVNAAVPGAGSYITLGVTVLEKIASIVDAGGAAAEQNLKNAGLDETVIAQVKSAVASAKAAA
jgi:hypothetical protein